MGWGVRTDRMWGYWQGNLYVLLRCRACVRVPGAQILVLCVVCCVLRGGNFSRYFRQRQPDLTRDKTSD